MIDEMLRWTNPHVMGFIPLMIFKNDPRSAIEQLNERYAHGGGWMDFKGFDLKENVHGEYSLHYPEDPPFPEKSRAWLRDELIMFFEFSWVCVLNTTTGDYRVARLD